jgi:hypothetical protein
MNSPERSPSWEAAVFYATWRFIIALSWAISIQSHPSLSVSVPCIYFFPFWLSHQNSICIPLLIHTCYMLCPSHPPWVDYCNCTYSKSTVYWCGWWIWKDLEGIGRFLIEIVSRHFRGGTDGNQEEPETDEPMSRPPHRHAQWRAVKIRLLSSWRVSVCPHATDRKAPERFSGSFAFLYVRILIFVKIGQRQRTSGCSSERKRYFE